MQMSEIVVPPLRYNRVHQTAGGFFKGANWQVYCYGMDRAHKAGPLVSKSLRVMRRPQIGEVLWIY